jgi:hypothetical protein
VAFLQVAVLQVQPGLRLYCGLQLKHLSTPIILGCYGSAPVGSVTAGYVLLIACKRQQVRDVCPPRLPS